MDKEKNKFFGNVKDYILNAKTNQKNRTVMMLLISLGITIVIILCTYLFVSYAFFKPVSMLDKSSIEVSIPRNTSLSKISTELKNKGLIRNTTVFKLYVDFSDYSSKIRSGTYQLNKTMSLKEIAKELTKGGVSESEATVVITEGMSIEDIANRLKDSGVINDVESFKKECNNLDAYTDYDFVSALKGKTTGKRYALEGYLFPDTYAFYTDSTNQEVIQKLLSRFDQIFTTEWKQKAANMNMSIDEIVTLASIVEKEAKTKDTAKVSAVFYNRIKTSMPLQSDVTIQYAKNMNRLALTAEDTNVDSPYNTYKNKGLPPGAVCNPGKAAIQAALTPDEQYVKEKYLYFCLMDPAEGNLAFAKTLEEHNANVEKYRALWEEYDKKSGRS